MEKNSINRRSFLKSTALIGAAGMAGTGSVITSLGSCTSSGRKPLKAQGSYYVPDLPDIAIAGRDLKAGVIGCGGRGSGAAINFLNAAEGVTITVLGDTFADRTTALAERLKKEKNIDIPEDRRFTGLDAYKQVIDSDIDIVIITTPPVFRPVHFKYAVEHGKHCFLEKPIFVDPAGYRTVIQAARNAQTQNLCVITGTQRHHHRAYIESYRQIMNGMIGEITGGNVYWNQSHLWFKTRQPEWSDCEWMIRDWVNWKWLSGDHIVEQHVHNIDVFTWFTGLKPAKAVGFGSRQRRVTGDQFDNFSVDFVMENGIHLHSMSRQIDGCADNVNEYIHGTEGFWDSSAMEIKDWTGKTVWKYDEEAAKAKYANHDPYTLEHVNLISLIRAEKSIDQASEIAIANMAAVMGRESAYTGKETTWDEMTASALDYTPADLSLTGKMDMSSFTVPVAGMEPKL